ncbi:hypothetical protein IRJ41_012939, partial [Triplophysa rosa]
VSPHLTLFFEVKDQHRHLQSVLMHRWHMEIQLNLVACFNTIYHLKICSLIPHTALHTVLPEGSLLCVSFFFAIFPIVILCYSLWHTLFLNLLHCMPCLPVSLPVLQFLCS